VWFDAMTKLHIKHSYILACIYNIDKSRFAVKTSQSSRALINICEELS